MTSTSGPLTPRNLGDDDAPHMSPVTPAEDARSIMLNKVSWGAVLAGVVVSLVTHLLLNLFGVGVGAATLDPATGDNPAASTFSIGAAIWWTISGILASLAGGYAAGRLAGKPKESTAGWHGLTSWALTTLVIFYLLTSTLGSIVGGLYGTLTSSVGAIPQGAGGAAQTAVETAVPQLAQASDPFSAIEGQVRSATGGQDPAALRDTAVSAMRALVTGDEAQADQARERAAQALAQARQIPIEQARTEVQQYEQQYREAVDQATQQAKEAADATATAVSTASLFSAIALLLGAIAAWFGGRWGTVDPTVTAAFLRNRAGR